MITQRRVADARQLVGERAGRLVVIGAALHAERPLPQAIDALARVHRDGGGAQHRARAVSKQHPKVTVAALGDPTQTARTAR